MRYAPQSPELETEGLRAMLAEVGAVEVWDAAGIVRRSSPPGEWEEQLCAVGCPTCSDVDSDEAAELAHGLVYIIRQASLLLAEYDRLRGLLEATG